MTKISKLKHKTWLVYEMKWGNRKVPENLFGKQVCWLVKYLAPIKEKGCSSPAYNRQNFQNLQLEFRALERIRRPSSAPCTAAQEKQTSSDADGEHLRCVFAKWGAHERVFVRIAQRRRRTQGQGSSFPRTKA